RADLGAVAHDGGVREQVMPEIVGLEGQLGRLEAEKGFLEARPFRFDHAPGKARGKHALGHFAEDAVVAEFLQRLGAGFARQQFSEATGPTFALFGAGQNGLERNAFGFRHHAHSSVARSPAISRPRSARLSTMMCSLSVCGSAPRTPRPSSVATPIAPVKFASDPPPAEACGSSIPSCLANSLAFS